MKLGIMGAGAIGCYLGGRLLSAGVRVELIGRASLAEEIRQHGLRITDESGFDDRLPPERVPFSTSPEALAGCDVVVVTVKGLDTAATGRAMAEHLAPHAVVISLQNGVRNPAVLREALPGRAVLGAMVPFNVVRKHAAHFHRGTSGRLVIEASGGREAETLRALRHAGVEASADPRIEEILWGKLLLNLNNPLNALSGLTLREQLLDGGYRRLVAACLQEGLDALSRKGISPRTELPAPLWILPWVLRLPSPLFRKIERLIVRIDAEARSSMWEDLQRGRKTEVDLINGEIVQLAESVGAEARVNRAIIAELRAAEAAGRGSPRLPATALLEKAGLQPG